MASRMVRHGVIPCHSGNGSSFAQHDARIQAGVALSSTFRMMDSALHGARTASGTGTPGRTSGSDTSPHSLDQVSVTTRFF